jgi:hypothetical protein
MHGKAQINNVKQEAEQTARQAVNHPWFSRLARFGYAAKGVVYLLAGLLSAQAAFGLRGSPADKQEVLWTLVAEPFGQAALGLIAVGLLGYVLLRFAQALLDPEGKGSDAKGWAIRAGYLISGLLYAGLAVTAVRLAFGRNASGSRSEQSLAARVFALPLGRWLAGAVGIGLVGVGVWQIYRGFTADFSEHLRWGQMSAAKRTWTTLLGRIGLAARGIVIGLVGGLLVQAALALDAGKVQGSAGALETLSGLLGPWAVAVVAVGLVAYGVYMLAVWRYARIVAG